MEFTGIRCPGDEPPCSLDGLKALLAELVGVLGLTHAMVDGFTDCKELPAPAAAALADLRHVASNKHEDLKRSRWYRWRRRKGPSFMAVQLDLSDPGHRRAFVEFGPYSINSEAFDEAGAQPLLVLHDSAYLVSVSPRGPAVAEIHDLLARFGATYDDE